MLRGQRVTGEIRTHITRFAGERHGPCVGDRRRPQSDGALDPGHARPRASRAARSPQRGSRTLDRQWKAEVSIPTGCPVAGFQDRMHQPGACLPLLLRGMSEIRTHTPSCLDDSISNRGGLPIPTIPSQAPPRGFEPRQATPKIAVLPITPRRINYAGPLGFEPRLSTLRTPCAAQLHYRPLPYCVPRPGIEPGLPVGGSFTGSLRHLSQHGENNTN